MITKTICRLHSLAFLIFLCFCSLSHGETVFSPSANVTVLDLSHLARSLSFPQGRLVVLKDYGNALLLGARDQAVNISLSPLGTLTTYHWSTANASAHECRKITTDANTCHNFVRSFASLGAVFLLCGTHGLTPTCAHFVYNQNGVRKPFAGMGLAPYDSDLSSPFVQEGNSLFTVNAPEYSSSDSIMLRKSLTGKQSVMRNARGERAFDKAKFVALEKNNEEVVAFFSENPSEGESCGLSKVARVARVCAQDPGDPRHPDEWTSFVKARLDCVIEEEKQDSLHFNQLTAISATSHSFFAVFRSQLAGLNASAVCIYPRNLVSQRMAAAFGRNAAARDCPRATKPDELAKIRTNPLITQRISQVPAFLHQGVDRFQHVIVQENVKDSTGALSDVIYIATSEGRVFKVVYRDGATNHVATFHVVKNGATIEDMRLHIEVQSNQREIQSLLLITSDDVIKVPAAGCSETMTCGECLRDPHCAWETHGQRCLHLLHNRHRLSFLTQSVDQCPLTKKEKKPQVLAALDLRNVPIASNGPLPCLCETTTTTQCTTEVIQKEIQIERTVFAWLPCVFFFFGGLLVGAVVNYLMTRPCLKSPKRPLTPPDPIQAFSSRPPSLHRLNGLGMTSSVCTYC